MLLHLWRGNRSTATASVIVIISVECRNRSIATIAVIGGMPTQSRGRWIVIAIITIITIIQRRKSAVEIVDIRASTERRTTVCSGDRSRTPFQPGIASTERRSTRTSNRKLRNNNIR